MRGKKRPTDERARAVGIAVVAGGAEASRQTGVPERTIQEWMNRPEFAELRARSKDEVATEWWAGIQTIARSIFRDIESASVRDRAVALGIVAEKMLLIRGEATTRSESRDLTDDLDDHEAAVLGELVREELARRAHPDPAAPVVEDSAPA